MVLSFIMQQQYADFSFNQILYYITINTPHEQKQTQSSVQPKQVQSSAQQKKQPPPPVYVAAWTTDSNFSTEFNFNPNKRTLDEPHITLLYIGFKMTPDKSEKLATYASLIGKTGTAVATSIIVESGVCRAVHVEKIIVDDVQVISFNEPLHITLEVGTDSNNVNVSPAYAGDMVRKTLEQNESTIATIKFDQPIEIPIRLGYKTRFGVAFE